MPLTLFCPCCCHACPAPDGNADPWAWCPGCGAEFLFDPPSLGAPADDGVNAKGTAVAD